MFYKCYSQASICSAHSESSQTRNYGYADVIFVMTTLVRLLRWHLRGTERVDRGTECVRAVMRSIALRTVKAHFSPVSWRFLLQMSCIHTLSSAAKCRGEPLLNKLRAILWPWCLGCKSLSNCWWEPWCSYCVSDGFLSQWTQIKVVYCGSINTSSCYLDSGKSGNSVALLKLRITLVFLAFKLMLQLN